MKHNHAINTYNHHTEFVCGLDLSLHSNTKVQYNPHYRLSVLNFDLFKSPKKSKLYYYIVILVLQKE